MLCKIAAVQMEPKLMQPEENLRALEESIRRTAAEGAMLSIFPEAAVAGYCFESYEEAFPYAETVPGPSVERLSTACRQHAHYTVYGTLEREGEKLYNTAVLVGPDGFLGKYRKIHLPSLGMDKFTCHGTLPLKVHHAGPLRLGMLICYDGSFPEAARCLALEGADLITLPTNWPPGAECQCDYLTNARAMENHIYYAAVNRVGTERGFRFIGGSRIADPAGNTMAKAGPDEPTILYAEIDPDAARNKHLVRVPGKHEINRFADRRPEMYGKIVEPVADPSPRRW